MAVYASTTSSPAAAATGDIKPPDVKVPGPEAEAPVKIIKASELAQLGQNLDKLFGQYRADRTLSELRWLRNLRQYLGFYDPDIEKEIASDRSMAYPRITRVKCISVLSRLMSLMFPGNERNWSLEGGASSDIAIEDVQEALQAALKADTANGEQPPPPDAPYVMAAVKTLVDRRAKELSVLIDDQLQELGGDQTIDYIALNRKVIQSGILYGLGVLRGPYVRKEKGVTWSVNPMSGMPEPKETELHKPMFEFMPIWDFYPDMSAKTLTGMDGYFTRMVMSRSQVKALTKRKDFFKEIIDKYLERTPLGNYRPQTFETELRSMGLKASVNEQKQETSKFEIIVWNGPVGGNFLQLAGVDVEPDKLSEEIDAEVWMIGGSVIKADINPWHKLGVDVKTIHTFLFDEDDTSVVGQGLPNVIRDSQMSVCAATRMLLDNASVTCGPNIEVNTDLIRFDTDVSSVRAYKIWYREGTGPEAQWPAVRNMPIDAHLGDLMQLIELFMKFADAETFVGPATGGDIEHAPSEPMRTAAGASMLRGDAALPFKDIVRNFDQFTQSVIYSLVHFNRKFNPDQAPAADYNVVARGATSLIAKEVRGMQIDQLAVSMTPEEKINVDMRKFTEARFAVRDLMDMLVPPEEAARRQAAQDKSMQESQAQQTELTAANVRKLLSDAFKNVAQGQKNSAAADATTVDAALAILEKGMENEIGTATTLPEKPPEQLEPSPPMPDQSQLPLPNGGALPMGAPEIMPPGMPPRMPPGMPPQ